MRFGVMEDRLTGLDLLDTPSEFSLPLRTDLDRQQALAQNLHELLALGLGERKRLVEDLFGRRCHRHSLCRCQSTRQPRGRHCGSPASLPTESWATRTWRDGVVRDKEVSLSESSALASPQRGRA